MLSSRNEHLLRQTNIGYDYKHSARESIQVRSRKDILVYKRGNVAGTGKSEPWYDVDCYVVHWQIMKLGPA